MADQTEPPESEQTSTPNNEPDDDIRDHADRALGFLERAVVALERIAAAMELAATAPPLTVEAERQLRDPTRNPKPADVLRQAEELTRTRPPAAAAAVDRVPRGFTPNGAPIY